jgi:hypothetical protein
MRRSSLRWVIPTILLLQLGLLWIQGAQLHRQNQVLQGLREDIQSLADAIDQSQSPSQDDQEGQPVPARRSPAPSRVQRVAVLGLEEDQSPAAKELKGSRESAQKAVQQARESQAKVSIQENARKAEEKEKVQSATAIWSVWAWGALALVALAFLTRSILRKHA